MKERYSYGSEPTFSGKNSNLASLQSCTNNVAVAVSYGYLYLLPDTNERVKDKTRERTENNNYPIAKKNNANAASLFHSSPRTRTYSQNGVKHQSGSSALHTMEHYDTHGR